MGLVARPADCQHQPVLERLGAAITALQSGSVLASNDTGVRPLLLRTLASSQGYRPNVFVRFSQTVNLHLERGILRR
jgi:hypothetical protein